MKKSHIIIFLMFVAGIALLFSATGDLSTYSTFTNAENSGDRVKIAGELVLEEEIIFDPLKDPNYTGFHLKDPDNRIAEVVLLKAKPQDFEMSEQVVVTGSMQKGKFVADEVLTKCPSKYKDEEMALRKQG